MSFLPLPAAPAPAYAVPLPALVRCRLLVALGALLSRGSALAQPPQPLLRSAAAFLLSLSEHGPLVRHMLAAGGYGG